MEPTLVAKICSMFILGLVSLLLGVLPIKLATYFGWNSMTDAQGSRKSQLALSALNCFGAGVILTTAMTHLLPEVNHFLAINIKEGSVSETGLPLAEVFFLCGFFLIYIVEELAHYLAHAIFEKYGDQHGLQDMHGHETMKNGSSTSLDTNVNMSSTPAGQPAAEIIPPAVGENIHKDPVVLEALGDKASFQTTLRGFLVILALSLHAVFEGIAMGLTKKASFVWYLTFAVAAHKYVIAFCIGVQFVTSGVKNVVIVIYVSVFALISPVGIAIGIALTEAGSGSPSNEADLQGPTVTVLQGLAAGTLLYVVFFEVLEKERAKRTNGILQVGFCVLGFVLMLCLQLLESGEDEEQSDALLAQCVVEDPEIFQGQQPPYYVHCNSGTLRMGKLPHS